MKKNLFIPKLTSNDESVRIVEWLIDDHEYVQAGQSILVVETSKTNVEIESEFSGYILRRCEPDQILKVAQNYATLVGSLAELKDYHHQQSYLAPSKQGSVNNDVPSNFSNAALKYLQEHGLNPKDFSDHGLVTVEVIKNRIKEKEDNKSYLNRKEFPKATIEPLPFSKLTEIAHLSKSNNEAISSSLTIQLDTAEIRQHFSKTMWLNRRIFSYILYVFSRLLSEHPSFLSYYHDKNIILYNKINLGIAMDLEKGLKVMTIEDPETLSLFDLQMSIIDQIANYHEDAINLSSIQTSTVTVTDLSQDNILSFQPVLNANQSIILGIGGDQTLRGSPMTFTIVFDHRVLTGQQVASFLKRFREKLLSEYLLLNLETELMEP